jgi:hypothetical protein
MKQNVPETISSTKDKIDDVAAEDKEHSDLSETADKKAEVPSMSQSSLSKASGWSVGSILALAVSGVVGGVAVVARYPTTSTLVAFGMIQYYKYRR